MGNASGRGAKDSSLRALISPAAPVPPQQQHCHASPIDLNAPGEGDGGRLGHHVNSCDSMFHSPPDTPGSVSRSPLMFTPQIPMNPMAKGDDLALGYMPGLYGSGEDYPSEKCVATLISWSYGGANVAVEGSWDNWSTRHPLHKAGKDFTVVKQLLPGVYQYKFVVDGKWSYAADLPAVYDEVGNVNNVLDVQDYVPENLENVAGFEPPPSPDTSYTDTLPGLEEFTKDPPVVPPHLHLTLLNAPSLVEVPGSLPRPQHVILNHTYAEKGQTFRSLLTLGLTHRYRSKFVSIVLYKPMHK